MVDIIRRKDVNVESPDVSSGMKKTADIIRKTGSSVGSAIEEGMKAEQSKLVQQQKAFDASDKLIAADRAGRLENDLLRWNLDIRQKNPNFIGTPDHERAMRDYYAKLSEDYVQGLGEVGRGEFTGKTQNAVNNMIANDIKWAYRQKMKDGEDSAKNIAESMNNAAGLYGYGNDIDGFKESHKENRKKLKDYMENVAPEGAMPALYELDKKSLVNFFSCMSENDPEYAKYILNNPEVFRGTLPDGMVENLNALISTTKTKELTDTLRDINDKIATEKDKRTIRDLEKQRKEIENYIANIGNTDYTEQNITKINDEIKQCVDKSINYNLNLRQKRKETEVATQKVDSALEFMDNPVLYRADLIRAFPEDSVGVDGKFSGEFITKAPKRVNYVNKVLDDATKRIYNLSDKVGDGKVDPATLQLIIRQVASITAGDNGEVDSNILKAFQGDIALREAGASPEQLQTYHKLAQIAMTDTGFKKYIADLANKPDFKTMFVDRPSRDTGLRSWFRTVKDDDTDFVEDKGRQAYVGAMNLMIQGKPEEALGYYDQMAREAYEFIKRDVVDTNFVNKELEKLGYAMVDLNGNMTKITGRLPNGEYIVESTGEKVDAKF